MKQVLIHVIKFLFLLVFVSGMSGCGGGGGSTTFSSTPEKQSADTSDTQANKDQQTGNSGNSDSGNAGSSSGQGDANSSNGSGNSSGTKAKPFTYIPQGDALTYEMAYKFLNLTTFGATKEDVEALQQKGVIAWVDEQLSYSYDQTTDSLTRAILEEAKTINPVGYPDSLDFYLKEDTNTSIPPTQQTYTYNYRTYYFGHWFKQARYNPKQLRLRVAYALSQIVVVGDSNDIFGSRYNAISAYYDLLIKHAFDTYGDLLKDISTNPAMGYYLTFYGNKAKYKNNKNEWVYPDENYAREVMQLFSIGPFVLTNGGDPVSSNTNGEYYAPTYTQKDVNEMARVFTGLDFRLRANSKFGDGGFYRHSDLLHKMECFSQYHDNEAKVVLGKTIPAGGTCYSDIDKAVDILMQHNNVAPFVVKKLIMRLAKSNPLPSYISRVVKVFNDNGSGVKGDLKAVVRAILLDEELWDDIKANRELKYKEPVLAVTQMFRVLKAEPLPKYNWEFSCNDGQVRGGVVDNKKYFRMFRLKKTLNQGPAEAQSVFNFYSDEYVPNDIAFMTQGFKAPEVQIQVDGFFVSYHNYIMGLLDYGVKSYITDPNGGPAGRHYDSLEDFGMKLPQNYKKVAFDAKRYYDLAERLLKEETGKTLDESLQDEISESKRIEVTTALVKLMSDEFLGGNMSSEFKNYLVNTFEIQVGFPHANSSRKFFYLYLERMFHLVLVSDEYMVE